MNVRRAEIPFRGRDANLTIRFSGSVVILLVEFRYYTRVLQQLSLLPYTTLQSDWQLCRLNT